MQLKPVLRYILAENVVAMETLQFGLCVLFDPGADLFDQINLLREEINLTVNVG